MGISCRHQNNRRTFLDFKEKLIKDELKDPLDRKCKLRTLNEMITCKICHGYLVDATTVTECLHTFCKSCIVKHLEDSNVCPECKDVIHQSHPLDYIAYDRTLQDLVYKIVPELEKDEYDRERKFYRERGLPCPKDQALEEENDKKEEECEANTPDANTNMDFHRFDEQVSLQLELKDDTDSKKYLIFLLILHVQYQYLLMYLKCIY